MSVLDDICFQMHGQSEGADIKLLEVMIKFAHFVCITTRAYRLIDIKEVYKPLMTSKCICKYNYSVTENLGNKSGAYSVPLCMYYD